MKILISGASGFIGQKLIERLTKIDNVEINILVRKINGTINNGNKVNEYLWDVDKCYLDENAVAGVDVVIHLAGENIFDGRWNKLKKDRIYNSRIKGTKLLVDLLKRKNDNKIKLISTSAIGIYGDQGSLLLDENSKFGDDFLSKVCIDWEKEALQYFNSSVLRLGVVLGKEGGALKQMLPIFKLALGGKIGNGKQYFSWIHIDDLIDIFLWLITAPQNKGIYNASSPDPIINEELTSVLGQILKKPTVFKVPAIMLKIFLGEKSQVLLHSQRVIPRRLIEGGFNFKYKNIFICLNQLLK